MLYTNTCLEEHERQQQNIGVWLSLARAPGLGPGGRRFESCHPDPFYGKLFYTMVGIAQLVSAPDCGSGGILHLNVSRLEKLLIVSVNLIDDIRTNVQNLHFIWLYSEMVAPGANLYAGQEQCRFY